MRNLDDISGIQFGYLIAKEPTDSTKLMYKCVCTNCGRSVIVWKEHLVSGLKLSCECTNSGEIFPQMQFDRFIVLNKLTTGSKNQMWECLDTTTNSRCDCSENFLKSRFKFSTTTRTYEYSDISGRTFGKLVAVHRAYIDNHNVLWRCVCQCDRKTILYRRYGDLIAGTCKLSCSCERIKGHLYEEDELKLYGVYKAMKQRCYNEHHKDYKHYGGRGIKICDEWLRDPRKFLDWSKDHGYNEGLTIERKNVDSSYCPENCVWIPRSEQTKNQRSNVVVTVNGISHLVTQWSTILGKSKDRVPDIYRKHGLERCQQYIKENLL